MTTLRLRKKVRFPKKVWKYIYCQTRWADIPAENDSAVEKFISTWGEGGYQIINSYGNVETSFYVPTGSMSGFRAKANRNGDPIIPDDIHPDEFHCAHCWHRGFDKGNDDGYQEGYDDGYEEGIYQVETSKKNKDDDKNKSYEMGFTDGYVYALNELDNEIEESNKEFLKSKPKKQPTPQQPPVYYNYYEMQNQENNFNEYQYPLPCIICGYDVYLDDDDSVEIYDEYNRFEGFAHEECADQDDELD